MFSTQPSSPFVVVLQEIVPGLCDNFWIPFESPLWNGTQPEAVRGFCILPLIVASYALFLRCLWTNLAEIQWTFVVTLGEKSINISAKSAHKRPRKYVSEATFDGKIQQPKLKGRPLHTTLTADDNFIIQYVKMDEFFGSFLPSMHACLHKCMVWRPSGKPTFLRRPNVFVNPWLAAGPWAKNKLNFKNRAFPPFPSFFEGVFSRSEHYFSLISDGWLCKNEGNISDVPNQNQFPHIRRKGPFCLRAQTPPRL